MDRTSQRLLKEDREHGDVMFPLAAYWIELPAGAPVLDTHWHEEAEFFLLLEGEILFQVDTDYFTLRPGEAVFIESGDIHAAYAALDTPCRFCALVFHPDLLASAQYDTIQQTVILPLQEKRQSFPRHITSSVPWQGELLLHLERMMEAYDNKMPGFESFMKGTLLIMLSQIAPPGRSVNYSQSAGADNTKIDRLKKVILYIQDNYQEPIRTRDLSELIPMSEGQFCRFFKSMTRKTPVDYINSYRIRQAAALLQQSDRKISDIAMDVGFDNVSYFIKVFRKAMNCSPSEFRKDAIPGAGQGQLYP
ncbi:helix-turn-helix domain-containing protein [Paenibacillus sp. LMG 31459]|uniref:Helix-turn-helix domain-containing protein n=1 Tax=Paenibacillus phytohabitans TaxID=2654978 RepID=A0ABX1YUK7_9BACL|nr:helix-turn-helix domain-containing protein [Paenibacillus phytohabitans]NOU83498.1 helix-turn-helix domain-containing protein [Paenibacillus phytohabitans]